MKVPVDFEALGELPTGWRWRQLQDLAADARQDIVDGPFGSNLKASEYVDEGVPIARLQNVDRNRFLDKNIRCVTEAKAAELARHRFQPGDILLTKLGDPLGKACIVPPPIGGGVIVADLVRIRPALELVDRRYLNYALNSPAVIRQLERHTKGTTRPRVNLSVVRELPIPVAPRNEQEAVVAEIEKQFSRLDEAVANLKRVKANLKRYKAAALKAAIEGGPLTHGTASSKGGSTQGWRWATIGEVATVGTGATPARSNAAFFAGGTIPWITSAAVNRPFVDEAEQFVTEEALEKTNLTLYPPGTLLLAMYGEGKTRGRCSELRIAATSNQALAAIQTPDEMRPWLKLFLEYNYENTRRIASGGVQPNLNLGLIKAIRFPLPPIDQRRRIVDEVARRFSMLDAAKTQASVADERGSALRSSILNRAFLGAFSVTQGPLLADVSMGRRVP